MAWEIRRLYSQLDQSRLALANDGVKVVRSEFEHVGCQRSADGQHRREESPKFHDVHRDKTNDEDESRERKVLRVDGGSEEPLSVTDAENRATWRSLGLLR